MNRPNFEQELSQQLDNLEREKLPSRDLWPGIELALVEEISYHKQDGRFTKLHLLAASILVVGALGWLSMSQFNPPTSGSDVVAKLSQQHFTQKQALLVRFKDQPALTENWQQQLIGLDEAESAIKAALKNDPNNLALLKLLQNVYQQQINLIERVHSPKWSQI
jgi:hypothetical protein